MLKKVLLKDGDLDGQMHEIEVTSSQHGVRLVCDYPALLRVAVRPVVLTDAEDNYWENLPQVKPGDPAPGKTQYYYFTPDMETGEISYTYKHDA